MSMKLSLQKHLITLLVSSCMTATVWAQAQALPKTQGEKPVVVLVKANGGLQVTSNDIMSELQRAPENIRESVMSRPEALQQLANNLIVRRILAAEGARDGLEKDPVVAASLDIARDRALSDARLARSRCTKSANRSGHRSLRSKSVSSELVAVRKTTRGTCTSYPD
jgi:peptidyl-prolyl cis-trans isomerase C